LCRMLFYESLAFGASLYLSVVLNLL
jgi:hypothetical protein